jgi:hypothetical protein
MYYSSLFDGSGMIRQYLVRFRAYRGKVLHVCVEINYGLLIIVVGGYTGYFV